MKNIVLFFLLLFVSKVNAQKQSSKATKTAYLSYARHLPTKYIVDSGPSNLIARKMNFALEGGVNFTYPINEKYSYQTGIDVHLHFIDEVTYGVTGKLPDFTSGYEYLYDQYFKGAEYIERVNISIPFCLKRIIYNKQYLKLSVFGGPTFTTYLHTKDELVQLWIISGLNRNTDTLKHEILRDFNRKKIIKGLNISIPQLEMDFGVEAERKLKHYGGIVVGIKMHLGAKNLESSTFTIWPDYPNLKSKGHFSLNRSYIGFYAGFRFGKNKQSKIRK